MFEAAKDRKRVKQIERQAEKIHADSTDFTRSWWLLDGVTFSDNIPYLTVGKDPKWDNSAEDWWFYHRAIEKYYASLMVTSSRILVSEDPPEFLNIPPVEFNNFLTRYYQRSVPGRDYYPTLDVVQALLHTDLEWIERDALKALPERMTFLIPPGSGLKVYVMGAMREVHDIQVVRVTESRRHRWALKMHELPPGSDADIYYYTILARDVENPGETWSYFGSFPVLSNSTIEDMVQAQIKFTMRSAAEVDKQAPDSEVLALVNAPALRSAARLMDESARWLHEDAASWTDAEKLRELISDAFKFILKAMTLLASEQADEMVKPLPIQGISLGKKASKQALEIQRKLKLKAGNPYRIELPETQPAEPQEGSGDRQAMLRHMVRGHFLRVHYGPGRIYTKLHWRMPFWRGSRVV